MAHRLPTASFTNGVIFTAAVLVLSLIGIVPGALLGVAGGAIFGTIMGTIYSGAGILLGAFCAFLICRSALRPRITAWLRHHGWLERMDKALIADGWRMVALLRVSPIMPFSITSYALSLSGISKRDYMLGTLAAIPPLLGYVALGALGGLSFESRKEPAQFIHFALTAFGVAATFILVWHMIRLLRRVGTA
ncbi:MAG: TVP38/TMEM64 family protein [Rhodospirillales bacterium]|nr:TVP38/TMEM64 family protein [Rhodospirillales bacterium]